MKISRAFLLVLGILLLAFALRMFRLDFFSLRGDEAFTVLFVQKPLAQMWHETLTVEPNPPLLYFALRGWIALAGDGEFATRFFSAFFGVLCVPLIYRLAREMFDLTPNLSPKRRGENLTPAPSPNKRGENVGLVAAFLVAVNPYQIWHSQDIRNYTLWPALSLLALIFFWQWYKRDRRDAGAQRNFVLIYFVLAELAALYAHYYEAFILLALNVFVFATLWRNREVRAKHFAPAHTSFLARARQNASPLREWLAAQIALAVLYLPYPLLLSNRVSAYGEGSGRQGVALWDILRETFSAFVLGDTLSAEWRAWLWLPLVLFVLASLVYLFTRDWKRGLFFTLYAGIPTLAVFALNTVRPLYLERYLNGIAPAYYLLLAYGIAACAEGIGTRIHLPHARRAVLAVAALAFAAFAFLALQNYWTQPAYAKAPDWRGLTRIINANAQPGDLIVQNFPEMSLLYYDRTKLPLVVYPETFLPDAKTAQQLNGVNANYQRVWFIPAAPDFWDPEQYVEQWLNRRGDLLNEWRVGDFRLRQYAMASQYLNTMTKSGAVFGDALRLLGYRVELDNNAPKLVLYWRVVNAPQRDLGIRVRYTDGAQTTQGLYAPNAPDYPTSVWRTNETVVSQIALEPGAAHAQEWRVSVCAANGEHCLDLQAPKKTRDQNELLIPFR